MTYPASKISPEHALDLVTDVWLKYLLEVHSERLGQPLKLPPASRSLEQWMLTSDPGCRQTALEIRVGAAKILHALDRAGILKEDF
jgi:hypothetical protein